MKIPLWMENLDENESLFLKNFVLSSGSLKKIANLYEVTYPTVRLRLDKLIQKIKINEDIADDSFVGLIKRLAIDEQITFDAAKVLITEYRKKGVEKS